MRLLISVVRRRHYSRLYTFKSQNMHCTMAWTLLFFLISFFGLIFNIYIKHDCRRYNINEGSGAIHDADNDPCIIDYDAGKFLIPSIRKPNKQTDSKCSWCSRCSSRFIYTIIPNVFFFFFCELGVTGHGRNKKTDKAHNI